MIANLAFSSSVSYFLAIFCHILDILVKTCWKANNFLIFYELSVAASWILRMRKYFHLFLQILLTFSRISQIKKKQPPAEKFQFPRNRAIYNQILLKTQTTHQNPTRLQSTQNRPLRTRLQHHHNWRNRPSKCLTRTEILRKCSIWTSHLRG